MVKKNSGYNPGASRIKKLDVSSKRLRRGKALGELQREHEDKGMELVRKQNAKIADMGVELLKVVNICGLGEAGVDQLIGRLLTTQEIAKAEPNKIAEWTKLGETFRLEINPRDRAGFFSVVVSNVDSDLLVKKVLALGLKYSDRYQCYEGFLDIASALAALRGTNASMRVRVGRPVKGKDGYIHLLVAGKVLAETYAEIFGGDAGKLVSAGENGAGNHRSMGLRGPGTPRSTPT